MIVNNIFLKDFVIVGVMKLNSMSARALDLGMRFSTTLEPYDGAPEGVEETCFGVYPQTLKPSSHPPASSLHDRTLH